MRDRNPSLVSARSFALAGAVVLLASALPDHVVRAQTIRRVPQDYVTIQSAIDAAADGESVLVAPGTYLERINFHGKAITVESVGGRDVTTIDGSLGGTVVTIGGDAGETPVLRGFTVRNGYSIFGGGVFTFGGPALIEENLITENFGCFGGGLETAFSAATVRANAISQNRQNCSGGFGGGISVRGAGTVKILDNVIESNSNDNGGGIALLGADAPTISGNIIRNNSGGREGGGISMGNFSNPFIVNNVIVGNDAFSGGGIMWLVPQGAPGPTVVNNTIAGNDAGEGAAIFADGFDDQARIFNNILVASGSAAVLHCGTFNPSVPRITFNDVFHTTSGPAYGGDCSSQTGMNGNVSDDPLFTDATGDDFHLTADSPAIDAGTNLGAPLKDVDGDTRPMDGDGDHVSIVDMGADEEIGPVTVPFFLHGSGGTANPPVLFLGTNAPTGSMARYKDSPAVSISGGNPWKEIGAWVAAPELTGEPLKSLGDVEVWVGLKNSDDQGTHFDIRIEVLKNVSDLVVAGEVHCIKGVTRNPVNAKKVAVTAPPFSPVPFDGSADVLSLRLLTRIGSGGSCVGHSNAVGLRLYFDAVSRDSMIEGVELEPPAP